jgi:DNA-binding NarL/FixJ family response regulator
MGKRRPIDDPGSHGNGPAPIRVLIADDHPLIRAGLGSTLASEPDILLVGEASSGEEAQRLCQDQRPDVLLLDLRMPGPSALETVACLRQYCPETKVLMLTAYDDEAHVHWLVEAGVAGYLLKDEAPATVVQAIRAVMDGGAWFSGRVAEKLARSGETPALTRREQEVLRLVVLGKTDQQIGLELDLAERTVRYYLQKVYEKLGVNTRVGAAVQAVERGWIATSER